MTATTGSDKGKEQGIRERNGEQSLSRRLLNCCKSYCVGPVASVLFYAIIQSTLLPKVTARSLQPTTDCSSTCDVLHSNRLRSNQMFENYQRCLIVCCMEEEIKELLKLKNRGFRNTKEETFDNNKRQNENSYFTRLLPFKGETPAMMRQKGNFRFSSLPPAVTKRSTRQQQQQNEKKLLFPFAYSDRCDRYVSVQYEHQVDKMRVLIPQKRRWGSTIGSCITAHCKGVEGLSRVDCITKYCHRTRRSNSRLLSDGSKPAWDKNINRLLQE